MEKDIHGNTRRKKAGVTILTSDKVDFIKIKKVIL